MLPYTVAVFSAVVQRLNAVLASSLGQRPHSLALLSCSFHLQHKWAHRCRSGDLIYLRVQFCPKEEDHHLSLYFCVLSTAFRTQTRFCSFLPTATALFSTINLFFPKRVVFLPCRWFFPVLINLIIQNPVGCLYWVTDGGLSLSPLELSHCQPGWQQGQLVLQSESLLIAFMLLQSRHIFIQIHIFLNLLKP